MRIHWKLIILELALEFLLELGPASADILATVAEYVVDLSLETSRAAIELIMLEVGQES
jgi:hypothetical protein